MLSRLTALSTIGTQRMPSRIRHMASTVVSSVDSNERAFNCHYKIWHVTNDEYDQCVVAVFSIAVARVAVTPHWFMADANFELLNLPNNQKRADDVVAMFNLVCHDVGIIYFAT